MKSAASAGTPAIPGAFPSRGDSAAKTPSSLLRGGRSSSVASSVASSTTSSSRATHTPAAQIGSSLSAVGARFSQQLPNAVASLPSSSAQSGSASPLQCATPPGLRRSRLVVAGLKAELEALPSCTDAALREEGTATEGTASASRRVATLFPEGGSSELASAKVGLEVQNGASSLHVECLLPPPQTEEEDAQPTPAEGPPPRVLGRKRGSVIQLRDDVISSRHCALKLLAGSHPVLFRQALGEVLKAAFAFLSEAGLELRSTEEANVRTARAPRWLSVLELEFRARPEGAAAVADSQGREEAPGEDGEASASATGGSADGKNASAAERAKKAAAERSCGAAAGGSLRLAVEELVGEAEAERLARLLAKLFVVDLSTNGLWIEEEQAPKNLPSEWKLGTTMSLAKPLRSDSPPVAAFTWRLVLRLCAACEARGARCVCGKGQEEAGCVFNPTASSPPPAVATNSVSGVAAASLSRFPLTDSAAGSLPATPPPSGLGASCIDSVAETEQPPPQQPPPPSRLLSQRARSSSMNVASRDPSQAGGGGRMAAALQRVVEEKRRLEDELKELLIENEELRSQTQMLAEAEQRIAEAREETEAAIQEKRATQAELVECRHRNEVLTQLLERTRVEQEALLQALRDSLASELKLEEAERMRRASSIGRVMSLLNDAIASGERASPSSAFQENEDCKRRRLHSATPGEAKLAAETGGEVHGDQLAGPSVSL